MKLQFSKADDDCFEVYRGTPGVDFECFACVARWSEKDEWTMRTEPSSVASIDQLREIVAFMEKLTSEAPCVGAFCDSDCREDFETRERMAKINGRV